MALGLENKNPIEPTFQLLGEVMIDLSYYENLPDFMPQHEIERELKILLNKCKAPTGGNLLDAIYELSSRQVNNYSLINGELRFSTNEIVSSCWDINSVENTETCIAIITNLGLQVAYEHLKEEVSNVTNPDVRRELDDAFNELGNSVENVDDIS